jgi:hypothetical protein
MIQRDLRPQHLRLKQEMLTAVATGGNVSSRKKRHSRETYATESAAASLQSFFAGILQEREAMAEADPPYCKMVNGADDDPQLWPRTLSHTSKR